MISFAFTTILNLASQVQAQPNKTFPWAEGLVLLVIEAVAVFPVGRRLKENVGG